MDKNKALKVLAGNVKTIRLNNGVSQKDVYDLTGIHIGRIEQGKRDISFFTILKLAEFHGVDPSKYFEGVLKNKSK